MKVTILVPIYGVERYIAECAESLLTQTYPDIEYVFCDDGTKDRSIEALRTVVARHAERAGRVRIIANDRNRGLGATRRHLLSEVRTEAFAFVDSDDRLPPEAVATLVARQEETGADIVEGAYQEFGAAGLGAVQLPSHASPDRYLRRVLCQNVVSNRVWGKLYITWAARRVPDLFAEGVDYSEDYRATARLAAVTSRAWTDRVVYHYRTDNAASYTATVTERSVRQYLAASHDVMVFYRHRCHLPFALETGLMNAWRVARLAGLAAAEVDEITRYEPESLTARLICRLLRGGRLPHAIGETLYRTARWITAHL